MKKTTTKLKEIAIELGVSITTVSRALRDCYDISDTMKNTVRQKAIEMGYTPNIVYQSIKDGNSKVVAIVISDFKNFYSSFMCDKLMNRLTLQNVNFTILCANGNVLTEKLVKQCISQKIDGVISLATPTIGAVDLMALNNVKFILIGSDFVSGKIHQISTDNAQIGKIGATYLSQFEDIESYFFIGNEEGLSYLRFDNFRKILLEKRSNVSVELICWPNDKEALISRLLKGGKIGCFSYNDEIIYDIYDEIYYHPNFKKNNIRFMGVDAIANHMPGLIKIPSIDRNYDEICDKAVKIIVNSLKDDTYPITRIVFENRLFIPYKEENKNEM